MTVHLTAAVLGGAGHGNPRQAPHGRTAPNITASDVQQATAGVYILSFLPTRNDAIASERYTPHVAGLLPRHSFLLMPRECWINVAGVMVLDVFTHLFNTDVLSPLLQSLRAFFMPFYLGHPLLLPFLPLYGTPAKCCCASGRMQPRLVGRQH